MLKILSLLSGWCWGMELLSLYFILPFPDFEMPPTNRDDIEEEFSNDSKASSGTYFPIYVWSWWRFWRVNAYEIEINNRK